MRIYKRADFLKLPEGILFCKGKPWYWGTLHVKGESLKNDFIDLDLCWIDDSGNDDDPIMTGMLENGEKFKEPFAECACVTAREVAHGAKVPEGWVYEDHWQRWVPPVLKFGASK